MSFLKEAVQGKSLNKSRRRRILALSLLPFCLLLLAFFYFEGSSEIFHVVSWLVPKIAPHSWHNWAGENICEVVVFPFDFFNFRNNTFINISWKYRFYVRLICIMLLQKEFPLFVKQLWKHSPRSIVKASEALLRLKNYFSWTTHLFIFFHKTLTPILRT